MKCRTKLNFVAEQITSKRGHVPQAKNISNLNAKKPHVVSKTDITLHASRFSLIPPVCNARNLQNLQNISMIPLLLNVRL